MNTLEEKNQEQAVSVDEDSAVKIWVPPKLTVFSLEDNTLGALTTPVDESSFGALHS